MGIAPATAPANPTQQTNRPGGTGTHERETGRAMPDPRDVVIISMNEQIGQFISIISASYSTIDELYRDCEPDAHDGAELAAFKKQLTDKLAAYSVRQKHALDKAMSIAEPVRHIHSEHEHQTAGQTGGSA